MRLSFDWHGHAGPHVGERGILRIDPRVAGGMAGAKDKQTREVFSL